MSLILWFDDGLISTYSHAYPVMQYYDFPGVLGVITGYVGGVWPDGDWRDKQCMSLEEVEELHRNGWDVVSHSVTHPHFSNLTEEEARIEIVDSKRWIRNHGFEDVCFVWPFGETGDYEQIVLENYHYQRMAGDGVWDGVSRTIPVEYVVETAISQVKETGQHVGLLFHGIRLEEEERDPWEITPAEFTGMMHMIYDSGVRVEAVSHITRKPSPILISLLLVGTYLLWQS